ncbi:hypothetical protein O3M35_010968 [Rhynocoris fuscipes]|uniref:Uncharacterized protein n=1 Tax=Rhynocoris fuscipes TaxID=488301 RepID=A0AAW1D3Q1_9HEMI
MNSSKKVSYCWIVLPLRYLEHPCLEHLPAHYPDNYLQVFLGRCLPVFRPIEYMKVAHWCVCSRYILCR